MKHTILFDLDGTLLPMDQDFFTESYFKLLCKKLAPYGYDGKELIAAIWKGTAAMVKNDGKVTNERAFWDTFAALMGERVRADIPLFDDFYRNDFNAARTSCGFAGEAGEIVSSLKERGKTLILASNPIFPLVAHQNRLRWAGVDPESFSYITSYENSSYCKPNPAYYREIAEKCSLDPEDCLMIGNDVREDTAAREIGMDVFLLTPCLIDREGLGFGDCPHGDYADLKKFLQSL